MLININLVPEIKGCAVQCLGPFVLLLYSCDRKTKNIILLTLYKLKLTALDLKSTACNATGQLHNDIILLQLHVPESFSLLFACANKLLGLLFIKPQWN